MREVSKISIAIIGAIIGLLPLIYLTSKLWSICNIVDVGSVSLLAIFTIAGAIIILIIGSYEYIRVINKLKTDETEALKFWLNTLKSIFQTITISVGALLGLLWGFAYSGSISFNYLKLQTICIVYFYVYVLTILIGFCFYPIIKKLHYLPSQ